LFHRRQAIFDHFDHWDKYKYAALGKSNSNHHVQYSKLHLGTFLGNHYDEATKAVSSLETELNVIRRELDISEQDLANCLNQERTYFNNPEKMPIAETLKIVMT
jgi:hypothetical protein